MSVNVRLLQDQNSALKELIQELRERIRDLEAWDDAPPAHWRVSHKTFSVMRLIAKSSPRICQHSALEALLDPRGNIDAGNSLKVYVCRARKVLNAYGIVIESKHGWGYKMTKEHADLFFSLLEGAEHEAA